jgi:hypothetical protein
MTNQHVSKPSVSTKITQYHINWRYNRITRIIFIHLPREQTHMTFMGHYRIYWRSRLIPKSFSDWIGGKELDLFSSWWISYHENINDIRHNINYIRKILWNHINYVQSLWTGFLMLELAWIRFSAWTNAPWTSHNPN